MTDIVERLRYPAYVEKNALLCATVAADEIERLRTVIDLAARSLTSACLWNMNQHTDRHQKAVDALRIPDASLRAVANTVRQSLADVIEEQRQQIDRYGLALMMIREGCEDPRGVARAALTTGERGDE